MTTAEETVTETREDIPLKQGKKLSNWYGCTEDCFSGFKFVVVAFGTLTCVITIALIVQISYGDYQIIPHGSVATDSLECSRIGTSILKQGGNAVDAAIASAFCLAVTAVHVTGLDAEGQMLIYNHKLRVPPTLIDFSRSSTTSNSIPPLVLGLASAYQQYGTLPWKDLVLPAADLAQQGYLISKLLVQAVTKSKAEDLYGRLEAGQILRQETLSRTLHNIANIPKKELYSYIQRKSVVLPTMKTTFQNYDIYVPNGQTIGVLVLSNLKYIENFNFTKEDTTKPEYIYRLAEVTLNTYVDENITEKFHEGTSSNVAVIDLNDYYVSLVTGMYGLFGSGEMTPHGYVSDVSKRDKPCSRIPLIITDGNFICGRRMVLGANNVAMATQLVASLLIAEENATESIESPRFHILSNGTLAIEDSHLPSFNDDVLKYFETLTPGISSFTEPYPSSNIVEKTKDDLSSHSDSRGGGIASRF